MSVDATHLFKEVDAIRLSGESRSNYGLAAQVLVNKQWLKPQRLDIWHLHRDYVRGFGDTLVVEMMIGIGTYTYQLIPNRDDLMVEISYLPLNENSDVQRGDVRSTTRRYHAIMMNQDNHALVGKHSQATDELTLNQSGFRQVQMQLVDEITYKARMHTVGRNFRKSSPMNALQYLLTETITTFGGSDSKKVQGVNITGGFNTEVRNQVTIRHGMPLMEVCDFLQDKEGGLYPTGAGMYMQDNFWWIYSLYDTALFKKAKRTLTILNVPKDRGYGAERTYRTTENTVTIIAAGDAASLDQSLLAKLNQGNSFRIADARKLLDFGVVKDNKMLIDRATNVFEVVGSAMKNGLNFTPWAEDRATSNPYPHYTEMAKRNGQYIKVEWMHGDSDELEPGMAVKFLTVDNNFLKMYYGVLHEVDEQRAPAEVGAAVARYPAMVTLSLFLTLSQDEIPPTA